MTAVVLGFCSLALIACGGISSKAGEAGHLGGVAQGGGAGTQQVHGGAGSSEGGSSAGRNDSTNGGGSSGASPAGGSASAGGASPGGTGAELEQGAAVCKSCSETTCAEQLHQCESNQGCQEIVRCIQMACAQGKPSCSAGCIGADGSAYMALSLFACITNKCGADCAHLVD